MVDFPSVGQILAGTIRTEGALLWAASNSDEKTRTGSVALGLAAWRKKAAGAAEAWVTQTGVPLPQQPAQ